MVVHMGIGEIFKGKVLELAHGRLYGQAAGSHRFQQFSQGLGIHMGHEF